MNEEKNFKEEKQKSRGNKVNKKPNKVVFVIVAVVVALFATVAAIVGLGAMYFFGVVEVENPNQVAISDYFSTDESGNFIATNTLGEVIVVEPKEQINILVLGKDRAAFNTDVMMIASYNVSDGDITIMQIPRDTYLEVFDSAGYANHKANSLLSKFYNKAVRAGSKNPMKEGLENFKAALSEAFGFPINYYVMVELDGFVDIINSMGGVEVDVPTRMYYNDPAQNLYIDLQPGKQILNGDQAEDFIRFRSGYVEGDIGRVDAQKIFISACIAQIKNNFSVTTISNIVEEVFDHVETNVTVQEMISYAKSALSIDLGKMKMLTIPGIQVRQYGNSGTWYYIVSKSGTIDVINKYFFPFNTDYDTAKFDVNGNLYDKQGTYLYTVYLTDYVEESYSADNVDNIYIYNYGGTSSGSKPSKNPPPVNTTTAATTTAAKTTSVATEKTSVTTKSSKEEIVIPVETTAEVTVDVTMEEPVETTVENVPIETEDVHITEPVITEEVTVKETEQTVITTEEQPITTTEFVEPVIITEAPNDDIIVEE